MRSSQTDNAHKKQTNSADAYAKPACISTGVIIIVEYLREKDAEASNEHR